MGIGGSDYSHRSGQRSSLRESGEGDLETISGPVHASLKATGRLGHPGKINPSANHGWSSSPRAHNSTTSPPSKPRSISGSENKGDRRWRADHGELSRRERPSPAREGNRQPVLERLGKIIPGPLPPPVRQLQGTLSSRKLTLLSFS